MYLHKSIKFQIIDLAIKGIKQRNMGIKNCGRFWGKLQGFVLVSSKNMETPSLSCILKSKKVLKKRHLYLYEQLCWSLYSLGQNEECRKKTQKDRLPLQYLFLDAQLPSLASNQIQFACQSQWEFVSIIPHTKESIKRKQL